MLDKEKLRFGLIHLRVSGMLMASDLEVMVTTGKDSREGKTRGKETYTVEGYYMFNGSASTFSPQTQTFSGQQTQYAQPQQPQQNMVAHQVSLQQVPPRQLAPDIFLRGVPCFPAFEPYVLDKVTPTTKAFILNNNLFSLGIIPRMSTRGACRIFTSREVEITALQQVLVLLDIPPSRAAGVDWKDFVETCCNYDVERKKYEKKAAKEIEKEQAKERAKTEKVSRKIEAENIAKRTLPLIQAIILKGKRSRDPSDQSESFFLIHPDKRAEYLYEISKDLRNFDLNKTIGKLRSIPCPYASACEVECEVEGECSIVRYLENEYIKVGEVFNATSLSQILEKVTGDGVGSRHIPALADAPNEISRFRMPPITSNETPFWNGVLSRCSCPMSFVSWIAKLFTPGDCGRQALYLRGNGMTGNTAIVNALSGFLSGLAISVNFRKEDDSTFRTLMRSGMLLSTCGDVTDASLFSTDMFKSLTGSELKVGEQKYGDMQNVSTFTKVLVTSNNYININPLQTSSYSRIIYQSMHPIMSNQYLDRRTVEDTLISELPAFIRKCRAFWENEIVANGFSPDGEIPMTRTMMHMFRNIEYSVQGAIRNWAYTHISIANEETCAYLDEETGESYALPAMITLKEVKNRVSSIMKKLKDNMDFLNKNTENVMDLIATRFRVKRDTSIRKYMRQNGTTFEVTDVIFGLKLHDEACCELDLGGLNITQTKHDYGLFLGKDITICPQQQQVVMVIEDDVWGSL
jgi:hypothetical protein